MDNLIYSSLLSLIDAKLKSRQNASFEIIVEFNKAYKDPTYNIGVIEYYNDEKTEIETPLYRWSEEWKNEDFWELIKKDLDFEIEFTQ